ncbi:hypothetical protein [Virgibacillus proomii]|jgi:hypothetical protein|uniref:hypothetical protein n=1 Tax=Virgibacillus proomii TaxID=84407 RepID=UPI00098568AB|nr:hypothetical protein [Virgibacillus proomii]
MKSYLRLTEFELGRFFKLYLTLMGLTIISQIIGIVVVANNYMGEANRSIYEESMSKQEFLEEFGDISLLNFAQTIWFLAPIAICITALLFYIFMIWYRDWFGKNTFIYRLLMLPTARINLFFAKATAILLMVFGLVALQIILLYIEGIILDWIVPNEFLKEMTIHQISHSFPELGILYPPTFTEFILYYGTGLMAVFILFTAILLERSFRWKGLLLGIGYIGLTTAFFLLPVILTVMFDKTYLYPTEWLIIQSIFGIILIVISIGLSRYLLKKRITV